LGKIIQLHTIFLFSLKLSGEETEIFGGKSTNFPPKNGLEYTQAGWSPIQVLAVCLQLTVIDRTIHMVIYNALNVNVTPTQIQYTNITSSRTKQRNMPKKRAKLAIMNTLVCNNAVQYSQ